MYLWTIWRIGETITNHSGYDFPWTVWSILPFQGSAYAHDAHHSVSLGSTKSGNYASFFIWWDYMMNSILPDNDINKVAHYKDESSDGGWFTIPNKDKSVASEPNNTTMEVPKKGDSSRSSSVKKQK